MQIWFEKPAGNLSFAGGPWRVNRIPSFIVSSSFLEPFFSCRPQHPGCRRRLAIRCIGCPRRLHLPSGPDIRAAGTLLSPDPRLFLAPGPVRCGKIKKKKEREGSEAPGGEARRRDLETPTANNKEIESNTLIYRNTKKEQEREMRKGIQPALEQYLVTAGGGEGAAVVAAAAAASMDKRALLASPGFAAAAAPGTYIQILTTNPSTTSCATSLQSGTLAAGPLLPSVPGAEPAAGSLLYTTPQGPSSRAGLLQQPPAPGRGGGGGPPVILSLRKVPSPGGRRSPGSDGCVSARLSIVGLGAVPPACAYC